MDGAAPEKTRQTAVSSSDDMSEWGGRGGGPGSIASMSRAGDDESDDEEGVPLPAGWEWRENPRGDQFPGYYVNATTSETSRRRPRPLPAGWVVKRDPQTGRTSYVNPITGETSATRPQPLPSGWEVLNRARLTRQNLAVSMRRSTAARVDALSHPRTSCALGLSETLRRLTLCH